MYSHVTLASVQNIYDEVVQQLADRPLYETLPSAQLLSALQAVQCQFDGTHFAPTLATIVGAMREVSELSLDTGDLSRLGNLLERADEWLALEMTRPGELATFTVTTPGGEVSVQAKSVVGARVAAAEMLYNPPFLRGAFLRYIRYSRAVSTNPVVRHTTGGAEATVADDCSANLDADGGESAASKLARHQLRRWPSQVTPVFFIDDLSEPAPPSQEDIARDTGVLQTLLDMMEKLKDGDGLGIVRGICSLNACNKN